MPTLLLLSIFILLSKYKNETLHFILNEKDPKSTKELLDNLSTSEISTLRSIQIKEHKVEMLKANNDVYSFYSEKNRESLVLELKGKQFNKNQDFFFHSGFSHFANKIPTWIFIVFTIFITIMAYLHNLSLIPILGLLSCLYMMSELDLNNWIYFTGWLLIGLIIYFGYSAKHSKLNKA
jgi:hypothetical protein